MTILNKTFLPVSLTLTLLRVTSLLGAALSLLVSVIVAFPTKQIVEASWFTAALILAVLHLASSMTFYWWGENFLKQQKKFRQQLPN